MIRRPISLAVSLVASLQLPKPRQPDLFEVTRFVWHILTVPAGIMQEVWKSNLLWRASLETLTRLEHSSCLF